jgi:hypothetical protein
MNTLILKKYLQFELSNYNYVLGSKLLIHYIDVMLIKHSHDEFNCNLLNSFKVKLISDDNYDSMKPKYDILFSMNNSNITIDLLCFFNPTVYGYFNNGALPSSNSSVTV